MTRWRAWLLAALLLAPAASAQYGVAEDPYAGLWEAFDELRDEPIGGDDWRDASPRRHGEDGWTTGPAPAPSARYGVEVRAGDGALASPGERAQVIVHRSHAQGAPPFLMVTVGVNRQDIPRRAVPRRGPRGLVYVADVAVGSPLVGRRGAGSYAIFRTTESQDAITARDALRSSRSRSLPRDEVMFFDETAEASPLAGVVSGTELFEAGGVHQVPVSVREPSGAEVARSVVPVAGRADWMYFSGHYPYTSGGQIAGAPIDPVAVDGARWREHLDTLIIAGCYAVDINAPGERSVVNHGRGVHGARWWKKFEGTLLGYRAMAPSHPGDSEVARRFLARVERLAPDPSDREAYSRTLAEAWMEVNVHQLGLTGASAVDAAGRYYYVRAQDTHLAGVPVRGSYRWTIADRETWQPQNDRLQEEYELDTQVFAAVRQVLWGRYGGRPPPAGAVLRDPGYQQAVRAAGLDPASPAMRAKLEAFLDYEAHIFYDVPRPDYYQQAIIWLADRQGEGLTPPSLDAVEAHFTPPTRRSGAQRPPRGDLETMLFQEYAWRAMNQPRWDGAGWRYPSASEAQAALARHFRVDARRAEYVRYLEAYLQGASQASATASD